MARTRLRIRHLVRALGAGLLVGVVCAQPPRTASLNLCSDVLLLALHPRERIASLSWLAAASPLSPVREEAGGIPVNHAAAEELILQRPELVVAQRGYATATLQRLRDRGIAVHEIRAVSSVAEALQEWRALGRVLGREAQAEALIHHAQARLAALPARNDVTPTAVIFGPAGYSYGKQSLAHDLLRTAGWDNLAAYVLPGYGGNIPLETLLLGQPDLVIQERDSRSQRIDTLGDLLFRHSLFESLPARAAILPPSAWTCAGPELVTTIETLAGLRSRTSP